MPAPKVPSPLLRIMIAAINVLAPILKSLKLLLVFLVSIIGDLYRSLSSLAQILGYAMIVAVMLISGMIIEIIAITPTLLDLF